MIVVLDKPQLKTHSTFRIQLQEKTKKKTKQNE